MFVWAYRLASELAADPVGLLRHHHPGSYAGGGKCGRATSSAATQNHHFCAQLSNGHLLLLSTVANLQKAEDPSCRGILTPQMVSMTRPPLTSSTSPVM